MKPSPQRDETALDLEADSSEELERVIISAGAENQPAEETVRPPANRRCDSAEREILRQPFYRER